MRCEAWRGFAVTQLCFASPTPSNAKPKPRLAIQALPSRSRAYPCRRCAPLCPAGTAPSFPLAWRSVAVPERCMAVRCGSCAALRVLCQCPASLCVAAAMRSVALPSRRKPMPSGAMRCRCYAPILQALPRSAVPLQYRAQLCRRVAMHFKAAALPCTALPRLAVTPPCSAHPRQRRATPSKAVAVHHGALPLRCCAAVRRYSVPNSFTPSSS